MKECFGNMNGKFCDTDWVYDECVACEDFDKCNKISSLNSLSMIEMNLAQIMENGEKDGWIKPFSTLEEEQNICPDCAVENTSDDPKPS